MDVYTFLIQNYISYIPSYTLYMQYRYITYTGSHLTETLLVNGIFTKESL